MVQYIYILYKLNSKASFRPKIGDTVNGWRTLVATKDNSSVSWFALGFLLFCGSCGPLAHHLKLHGCGKVEGCTYDSGSDMPWSAILRLCLFRRP